MMDVYDDMLVKALVLAEGKALEFKNASAQEHQESLLGQWEAAVSQYLQVKKSYLLEMVELKTLGEKKKRRLCLEAYDERMHCNQQDLRSAKARMESTQLLGSPGKLNPFATDLESGWLRETKQVQDKTFQSLATSRTRMTETVQIGINVGENLETQAETIKRTGAQVHLVKDEITMANETLKSLARRIFTDKIILFLALILIGLVIAIIVVFSTGAVKAPG